MQMHFLVVSDQDSDEEPDSDNGNKENVETNATGSRSGELVQLLEKFVVSEDRIRCECKTKCKRRDVHMIINKNTLHCTSLITNYLKINNDY
ncbi:unnamed protein product [Brachionus calyciflorus]|uniref:Uncharacterized protein n=1 Tax=Brachionus calyciflorus TaxID=104777 RepID=A0A813X106_9BILA|nr:unnamed protein product [Brachionus calyciflorus]